jgi:hypothetical protein
LFEQVKTQVEAGRYDQQLLTDYSQEEFDLLDSYLVHDRDMHFAYAAVKQLEGKYLLQNRVTGEIYESPQFLYMLVAACLFANYPRTTRLDYIKRFYDAVSTFKISLPTPIIKNYSLVATKALRSLRTFLFLLKGKQIQNKSSSQLLKLCQKIKLFPPKTVKLLIPLPAYFLQEKYGLKK